MSKVPESELYFLVLHWLRSGPCQTAADTLQHELQQLSLLPTVPSISQQSAPDYSTLCSLFRHVPSSALRELVEECIARQSDDARQQLSNSVSILEATGSLSFIPSVRTQITPSTAAHPPPSCRPNFTQRLLQREAGYSRYRLRNVDLMDNVTPGVYADLQHVKTLRGHRKAVYCLALDRSKTHIITGADDGIIKIWNLDIGLLKTTCRGHLGEITDLRINTDETLFASCSTDGTSRVWSLAPETLGHHVKAMIGHQNGVTYISFHPTLPHALLSVSLDGTCRLWHVLTGIELLRLKPVGQTGHFYNRDAFEKPLEHAIARQNEIRFFPDIHEVDLSLTCCAFSPNGEHFAVSSHSGQCFIWHWNIQTHLTQNGSTKTWPDATLAMELIGHRECVSLLLFNHLGTAMATASSDGDVKVWKPLKKGHATSSPSPYYWSERWSFSLPDPLPCPAYNNRRRKSAPQCNQIAWSCNDQFLLAAFSCSVIMVWNVTTGEEENILYGGHTDTPVHVLEAHPTDPKLCFSAGYDGMLILWDILNGRKISTLSSKDTHPGRWRWADPIQFVDGRFQHDGMGIVVTDVAGQFHLYGLEKANPIMQRTPYDQFFLYDYDKVIISDKGEPIDMESGELQHIHRTRFSMADITEEPYDPHLQEILTKRTDLMLLPKPTDPPQTPSSLLILPPTASAALWLADESGLGPQATATRVSAAQRRQIELMQEEGDLGDVVDLLPPMEIEEPPELPDFEQDDDSEGSEYTPDEGEPSNSPLVTRRSERIQTRTSDHRVQPQRRRIPTRQHPEIVEDLLEILEEDEEQELTEVMTDEETDVFSESEVTSSDDEAATHSQARPRRDDQQQVTWRITLSRRPQRRVRPERLETFDRHCLRLCLYYRRSQRLRRTRITRSPSLDQTPPRRLTGRSARSQRAARRAAARGRTQRTPRAMPIGFDSGRNERAYKWLSETRRPLGYYAPQVGDDIVYFSKLHKKFCDENIELGTTLNPRLVGKLRFAEPCTVVQVHYEIYRGMEVAPTVAYIRLRFTENERFGDHALFDLYIPPPFFGHEEFVVSRSLFDRSMAADWYVGQPVEAIYFADRPEPWRGVICELYTEQTKLESYWDCEEHYGRYIVEWVDMDEVPGSAPEPLSPWDMVYTSSLEGARQRERESYLSGETRRMLLELIDEAKASPESAHFRETVSPDTSFVTSGRTRQETRTLFYNQVVALPMSLHLIKSRLSQSTYYRSVAAVKHDVHLIVANAHHFTEPGSGVSQQADELEAFILQNIDGLDTDHSETVISSEDDDFKDENRRRHKRCLLTQGSASITSQSDAGPSSSRPYQIRTRGMAKRDRQADGHHRVTRRRRLNA